MKTRVLLVAGAALAIAGGAVSLAIAENEPATQPAAAPPAATAPLPAAPPAAAPLSPASPAQSAAKQPAAGQTAAKQPEVKPPAIRLSQAELAQLLAPIALYPDQLLDQVLMAATYPVEVVEAARWVKVPANRRLRGDVLMAALKANHWDPAVMALVPFPRLLDTMSDKLQWTGQVGNAFLAQQADVMAAVQSLRREAMLAGNLETAVCHCRAVRSGEVITIRPANPAAVYVPVCNPVRAYGTWRYPLYPPVVFPVPVGYVWAPVPFIAFYPVVTVAYYGPLWGWAEFDWWHRNVIVDAAAYDVLTFGHPAFAGTVWAHDPARRGGVAYAAPAFGPRFASASAVVAPAAADRVLGPQVRGAAFHTARRGGGPHAMAMRGGFHHGGPHGTAFHGGPHAMAMRGGFHHGGPHGAAFHGGPHMMAMRGGFHRGGPHMMAMRRRMAAARMAAAHMAAARTAAAHTVMAVMAATASAPCRAGEARRLNGSQLRCRRRAGTLAG